MTIGGFSVEKVVNANLLPHPPLLATLYTLLFTLYTLHFTLYTLHTSPYPLLSKYRSASSAALQPEPAATMAWR